MKLANGKIENDLTKRCDRINGFEVAKMIQIGTAKQTQPYAFYKTSACIIDRERGGIFAYNMNLGRWILFAKKITKNNLN